MATITVNGIRREVNAPGDTPLLYVLRNDLELTGPQFGCGLAQCGACSILIDGKEVRSCITALSDVGENQEVTTLEGLPARWAKQKGIPAEEAKTTLHPVQQAWIEEQTPRPCGWVICPIAWQNLMWWCPVLPAPCRFLVLGWLSVQHVNADASQS